MIEQPEITIKDQLKRLAIKDLVGFQTIFLIGIGHKLNIFDYLFEIAQEKLDQGVITSVTFTLNDLVKGTGLNSKYLEGWLHMALECGLFELDPSCEKCFKTAPFIYQILVDKNNMVNVLDLLATFFSPVLAANDIVRGFKTGEIIDILDLEPEIVRMGQSNCSYMGAMVDTIFSKYCKEHMRILRKGGLCLEVGVGYGNNLKYWAKKYKKARFVCIDIDPNGIKFTKQLVKQNNWEDRVEVVQKTIKDFAIEYPHKFEVILLNQVLHEVDPSEKYRISLIDELFSLLKDTGILVVGESIVPDIYTPKQGFQLYEIMHKWLEVAMQTKMYDEVTFRKFISKTKFKIADLIKEGRDYAWVLKKP